ncbi:MAG TPA: glycosyltransferase family 39 protein [Candidatus Acidoferrum sp.]|nr:glycosyltransferase family 39 protein [Candidatus Acidoferrum sp.]
MSEQNSVITENSPTSTAARLGWALLILATLYVCYFSHLGAIGFVGPDEPRYAWIARDMMETGDWVTPRLYGKPWFEKPPLFYWGAALCFKLFGASEAAARLPSAISALLGTLALAWLALRLYGAETARWLLLLLPTTVGMIGFSHAAATDMPFSGMLTIAMVCAAVVLGFARNENSPVIPQTAWLALISFGFFLGLAVLAKGPAAIILTGGAILFWALFTKRWRDAFRLFHPAALTSFCLSALPWYILCARRNPDFFRIFIIEHNFKRYLTPEFQHIQPFWFYVPVLLIAFLPWIALLLWSTVEGAIHLWRLRCAEQSTCFLVSWAGFCVLFFSISQSKLPGYILPAVPMVAILIAHDLTRRLHRRVSDIRWVCLSVGLTLIALGIVAWELGERIRFVTDIRQAPTVGQFSVLMVLVGIAIGILAVRQRVPAALVLSATVVPFFMTIGTGDLWQLDAGVSARPAAQGAINHLPESELATATTYKLQRGLKLGLNFYLRRELSEWSPPAGHSSIIFTAYKGSEELQQTGIRCLQYIPHPAVEICVDSSKVMALPDSSPGREQPH